MRLPDTLRPVLLKAISVALDERKRHLKASENDDSAWSKQEVLALRAEIELFEEARFALLQLALR